MPNTQERYRTVEVVAFSSFFFRKYLNLILLGPEKFEFRFLGHNIFGIGIFFLVVRECAHGLNYYIASLHVYVCKCLLTASLRA